MATYSSVRRVRFPTVSGMVDVKREPPMRLMHAFHQQRLVSVSVRARGASAGWRTDVQLLE